MVPHRQRIRSLQRCAPSWSDSGPHSSCRNSKSCLLVGRVRGIYSSRSKRRIVAMEVVAFRRQWSGLELKRNEHVSGNVEGRKKQMTGVRPLLDKSRYDMTKGQPALGPYARTHPRTRTADGDRRDRRRTRRNSSQGPKPSCVDSIDGNSPFSGNVGPSLCSPPPNGLVAYCLVNFGPGFAGRLDAIGSVPPQAEAKPLVSGPMRPSCFKLASCASATLCSLAKPCCLSWDRWNIGARSR